MPHIVIEAKTHIRTNEDLKQIRLQLGKTVKYWGRNTIGVILCGGVAKAVELLDLTINVSGKAITPTIYFLIFDSRNNAFAGHDYDKFKKDVISKYGSA